MQAKHHSEHYWRQRLASGSSQALGELFEKHRPQLRQMVAAHVGRQLRRRVDPSDVLQESYIEVSRRLASYLDEPAIPLYPWMRRIVLQRVRDVQRRHIGCQRRSVRVEATQSEANLGLRAAGHGTAGPHATPSEHLGASETRDRVERLLGRLSPADAEVLRLRHFEHLTNVECAARLGIEPSAASKRYLRALVRFRELVGSSADSSIDAARLAR